MFVKDGRWPILKSPWKSKSVTKKRMGIREASTKYKRFFNLASSFVVLIIKQDGDEKEN